MGREKAAYSQLWREDGLHGLYIWPVDPQQGNLWPLIQPLLPWHQMGTCVASLWERSANECQPKTCHNLEGRQCPKPTELICSSADVNSIAGACSYQGQAGILADHRQNLVPVFLLVSWQSSSSWPTPAEAEGGGFSQDLGLVEWNTLSHKPPSNS